MEAPHFAWAHKRRRDGNVDDAALDHQDLEVEGREGQISEDEARVRQWRVPLPDKNLDGALVRDRQRLHGGEGKTGWCAWM